MLDFILYPFLLHFSSIVCLRTKRFFGAVFDLQNEAGGTFQRRREYESFLPALWKCNASRRPLSDSRHLEAATFGTAEQCIEDSHVGPRVRQMRSIRRLSAHRAREIFRLKLVLISDR